MPAPVRGLMRKLQEPIVTNRGLDLLAAFLWASLAWWGIWSAITGIPTITAASSPLYELVWGGTIGILSIIAAFAAASTFIRIPRVTRLAKRWVELVALFLLAGFVLVYPMVMLLSVFNGDSSRTATLGLGVYVLGPPIWRIIHNGCRIRALHVSGNSDHDG